jgi:hypothetical protein
MQACRKDTIRCDRATSAMRVASSAPRLDLALEVQRQLLAQEEGLGGEWDGRPQYRRQESEDVASDARNRAHVEPRTGLCHAVGCYFRRRLVQIDRGHKDTLHDPSSARSSSAET